MQGQIGMFDDDREDDAGEPELEAEQPEPFHDVPETPPKKRRRNKDVETSDLSAKANREARQAQKRAILGAFMRHRHDPLGLTADEVDALTGDQGYWRRMSELREDGLIEWLIVQQLALPDGSVPRKPVQRRARSGRLQRASVVTQAGVEAAAE